MYIKFPMKYMNITQGYGVGTHRGTYAIDNAGKDSGIDNAYAPFTGKIKKIWNNGHSVWLESTDKVLFANGHRGYAVFMATHDNNIASLYVGQIIKQGQTFYQEGTAGNATGNHVHMEQGKSRFRGTGWFKNLFGIWTINDPIKPQDFYFINDVIVKNGAGYKWKKYLPTPTSYRVKAISVANVRDKPSTSAKVVKVLKKGDTFRATGTVKGTKVSGNDRWYKTTHGNYVWTGNCKRL